MPVPPPARVAPPPLDRFAPWADPLTGAAPQRDFLAAAARSRVRVFRAGNQAQPLDEPVLTPGGWRPLGDLAPGDPVIAGDGSVTTILAVRPQGLRPVLRLTFDDGASARCTHDHLWRVLDREGRFPRPGRPEGSWRLATAAEIRWRWGDDPSPVQRVAIPAPGPVATDAGPLPLDPYLLGALLGDGSLGRSSVSLSSADPFLVEEIARVLPPGMRVRKVGRYDYRLVVPRGRRRNPLLDALRGLGLAGNTASDKAVPHAYLFAPPPARLALLQGLLDTDGDVDKRGHVGFASVSARLVEDVVHLVRSLGGKARAVRRQTYYAYRGERRAGRPSWRVHLRLPGLPLFRLPRKLARTFDPTSRRDHRVLRRVRDDGESPCACITVAHPQGMYVTRDFVVTHNSGKSTVSVVDALLRCLGAHHAVALRPGHRPGPVRGWLSALDWEWGVGQVLWPAMVPWVPWSEVRSVWWYRRAEPAIPHTLIFRNGSELAFKSADAGRRKYQGSPLDFVGLDEEHPADVVEECRARLLARGGDLWATLTPVRRERWVLDLERQPGTVVVRASSLAAARAGLLDPAAVGAFADALPDRQRRVRLEGDFAALEGLVYPEWDRAAHVLVPDATRGAAANARGDLAVPWPIPHSWPRRAAIDWGYAVPTALVVARRDPASDLVVVERGAYAAQVRASVWARLVPELVGGPLAGPLVSDHDAGERAEANAAGVPTAPARKDVVEGLEAVARRLHAPPGRPPRLAVVVHAADPPRHPVVGRLDGAALAGELDGYRYPAQPGGETGGARDLPIKRDDHAADALRYLVMALDDARGRGLRSAADLGLVTAGGHVWDRGR